MASDRRKSLNRLSALFLPRTKTFDGPVGLSKDSPSPTARKVRKLSAPLLTAMSFSSNWPLPESAEHAAETQVPAASALVSQTSTSPPSHRAGHLSTPENALITSPLENGPKRSSTFPLAAPEVVTGQDQLEAPISPPFANAQRPRSASSSSFVGGGGPLQGGGGLQQGLGFPNGRGPVLPNVISTGVHSHSTADLLQPQQNQHHRLLKQQKSENALRHKASAATSANRAVSANAAIFQPSRAALIPPLPTDIPLPVQNTLQKPPLQKKKKSWLPGKSTSKMKHKKEPLPAAWIAALDEKVPYNLAPLATGSRIPELWQETGNVLVHLFPKSANKEPAIRINADLISSSSVLTSIAHGNLYSSASARQSRSSLGQGPVSFDPQSQRIQANTPGSTSISNSPNASHTDGSDNSREARGLVDVDESQMVHLYLPVELDNPNAHQLSQEDVQKLLLVRNLFAFLVGTSLICTPKYPSTFNVFCQISNLLFQYGFSNMDSSTFGEAANSSFEQYIQELGIVDVRHSTEHNIQALVLGERMRSSVLWNEAFVHAVGRYNDIYASHSEIFKALSPTGVSRIERAHMDLEKRIIRIGHQITDFDFPSVFAGIMNSRMAEERELVRFEQWRTAFNHTRKFMITYLKSKHKSWPPKKRKHAGLSVPALSRTVLQGLYNDIAVIYDLLVDRKHPSSRLKIMGRNAHPHMDRRIEALRKVLKEYDASGSPVYPVMPFDAPRLPRISPNDDDASNPKKVGKNELSVLLKASYNKDTHDARHPFSQLWQSFEFRSTTGMTIDKVANFRLGAWLFFYCVLQALPMLTVDAPVAKYTEGVDYFLCQPPRGRLQWSKEGTAWEWFRDPVTGVVTQLSKDAIDMSDEALYCLSHCWQMSAIWEQDLILYPGRPSTVTSEASRTPPMYAQGHPSLPTPPASEYSSEPRYSATSSQGHFSLYGQQHQAPGQMEPVQESYPREYPGSPQSYTQFESSPQLTAHDQSPRTYAQNYHQSSPDLLGLEAPSPFAQDEHREMGQPRSRNGSPYGLNRRGNRESILMMGLERLPVPQPSSPMSREQRSARTASMTFEEILAPPPGVQELDQKRARSRSRQTSRASALFI
ncbi:hypothetical protein BT63DRAFT_450800 [Microthyrium microscopicum]|uniref:DUF8004 domain-containing protein n=1 Tax=Microthyrium microscopicum TaxID=703497 RepID=A0A6A6UMT7_9PEZI|nr:hypothetical protein BT63DRAFT_450800 [Microthyrium microscopicum]